MLRWLCYIIIFHLYIQAVAQVTPQRDPEGLPLWEAGVGIGGASFPAYPGSDEGRFFAVPFPTFVYRGELIRSDEEGGVRGVLFEADRFEVNLSFGGSFPTDSSQNDARNGMEDLPLLVEVGPSLLLKFIPPSAKVKHQLNLNIPIRIATSVEFPDTREEGVIVNPFLFYIHEDILTPGTILLLGLDTIFATRKYMDFYYRVEDRFALPSRPAFRARAGYGGTGLVAALSYLFKEKYSVFGGVYHARYEGAANVDSPLFRTKHSTSFFLGLIWWGWKSEKTVEAKKN